MTTHHNTSKQSDSISITLTEKAAEALKKFCPNPQASHWGLKFADEPSRCSEGFTYVIDFLSSQNEHDEIFYSHGIKICVPKASVPRLLGSVIDFHDPSGPIEQTKSFFKTRFHVHNPNAKGPCPCACGDGVGY